MIKAVVRAEGSQQNMIMMIVMPIFLVFISWSLPSGGLLIGLFQTYSIFSSNIW